METNSCLLDKFIVDFSYQKVTEISRMTKQVQNNIKILFVCHGNTLRGVPIGLNVYSRENARETSWTNFLKIK